MDFAMPQPNSGNKTAKAGLGVVTKNDYLSAAAFLLGSESTQRVSAKKDPNGEAVRETADLYANREYVEAYERFKPAYESVMANMQRVLARNIEFEANKIARQQRVALPVAKERVQRIRTHAQEVIDHFDRLFQDLQRKPLVRAHIRKGDNRSAASEPIQVEASPTTINSANETWVESVPEPSPEQAVEIAISGTRYAKTAYAPPEKGFVYSVRDKAKGERIIRVVEKSADDALVDVEILEEGTPPRKPIQLAVESLARQAARGWCSLLVPMANDAINNGTEPVLPAAADADTSNVLMRLDSQNFGRCCGDIVRANLKFSTQLIKDVADGPFRAGNYEQAFLTFEQLAVGFNSAVANSRRAITDGRRALTAEKGNLSGKEIQERIAAFVRSESLIHTAEREFSTILEGLRMYLRARDGSPNDAEG
jgi:hypothetical protein